MRIEVSYHVALKARPHVLFACRSHVKARLQTREGMSKILSSGDLAYHARLEADVPSAFHVNRYQQKIPVRVVNDVNSGA